MNLIFIYGPPATGKYTVAEELCRMTGYKNFHNHLTFDIANTFYEVGDIKFIEIVRFLRLSVMEKLLEQKYEGIVFTYCYDKQSDDAFVENVIELFEKYEGKINFVNLYCDKEQLKKRVVGESRTKFGKIKDEETLEKAFEGWDPYNKIEYVESLVIDNTNLKPIDVVEKIIEKFGI